MTPFSLSYSQVWQGTFYRAEWSKPVLWLVLPLLRQGKNTGCNAPINLVSRKMRGREPQLGQAQPLPVKCNLPAHLSQLVHSVADPRHAAASRALQTFRSSACHNYLQCTWCYKYLSWGRQINFFFIVTWASVAAEMWGRQRTTLTHGTAVATGIFFQRYISVFLLILVLRTLTEVLEIDEQ